VLGQGAGERRAGSGERGAGSGERGAGSGGAESGERGAGSGERGGKKKPRDCIAGIDWHTRRRHSAADAYRPATGRQPSSTTGASAAVVLAEEPLAG
jgi:hypothetical protein